MANNTDGGVKLIDGSEFPAPRGNLEAGHYWQDSTSGSWIFYGGPTGNFKGYWRFPDLATLEKSRQHNYISGRSGVQNISVVEDASVPADYIYIKPLENAIPSASLTETARYPTDNIIDGDNDYVYFQFGKYIPPFSKDSQRLTSGGQNSLRRYAQSSYQASTQLKVEKIEGSSGIVLPMPQDLGNDIQQTWNGKQFSAIGRAAIAGAAGGNLSEIGNRISDFQGNTQAIVAALQTQLLNKIPGVGGNLDMGDITGSTQGIVLNPNAEILYDSPELREIGMTFKMIPRNATEAAMIKKICFMFRYASVPEWGGKGESETTSLSFSQDVTNQFSGIKTGADQGQKFDFTNMDNFMRVPYLCKFTFMQGQSENRHVQQFKPCAIRKVAVNYTSDGTYATYKDGEPVATELTLNFLESKVLFKDDIKRGF